MAKDNLLAKLLSAGEDVTDKVHIERIGFDIEIKALRQADVNAMRAKSTYADPKNKGKKIVNEEELNLALIEEAVVGPSELFSDELKKHYGTTSLAETLDKVLLVGEMAKLGEAIGKLNGVSQDDIDSAKN